MQGEFEMSIMGELTYFLGLQVKQLKHGTFLSQSKYCFDLLIGKVQVVHAIYLDQA